MKLIVVVRDEWDNKKANFEKQLSDILTVPWTIDVNPNQIYAYAKDGYAKESLGNCLASYFEGAIYRLKEFVDSYGEHGLNQLNTISHAHAMTMDVDESKQFTYCGADIHEGKLRILFAEDRLGSNIDYALEKLVLLKALNNAPAPEGSGATLSFAARMDIQKEYSPKAEGIQKQIAELLARSDIKLNPNFEDTYAKLSEAGKDQSAEVRPDWQGLLGAFTRQYFEGLASQLKSQKFGEDDLLQEGLNEELTKGQIAFRIVDKLERDLYSEAVFEDGVLYLQVSDALRIRTRIHARHSSLTQRQCTPKTWGVNMDYTAEGLADIL
ncbi:hypothetical protein SLS62_000528 [Diatrype stigma]|uniref:Uncharacterized protein n=1 Tax=Diatrype stigma TaxID=117547 RepID=A0AAN9UZZ7_9PEZI